MRTLFVWENCHVFEGQRAYWVEAPLEVFLSDIQGAIHRKNLDGDSLDAYLKSLERAAKAFPELIKHDYVYLLVREDGMEYEIFGPMMPYSNQWNGYCPLIEFQKDIADLSYLPLIDKREVDAALKNGRTATWCL